MPTWSLRPSIGTARAGMGSTSAVRSTGLSPSTRVTYCEGRSCLLPHVGQGTRPGCCALIKRHSIRGRRRERLFRFIEETTLQHALRLSRTDGARLCLWCGAAQRQSPSVTRHKTRDTAYVPGWRCVRRRRKRERGTSGRWQPSRSSAHRRVDAGPGGRDAPAQTRAACPGGGVVRCRTPSRQSQENGTTKDSTLVWTRYTAKDGMKKSSLWAGAAGHSAGTDAQADGQ